MSIRGGILIGGQSSRMGTPKHLLNWRGSTFAEHLKNNLNSHVDHVTFLGEGALPDSLAECSQLKDDSELNGPLAGILTALRSYSGPWLIVACDLPLLSHSSFEWLLSQRKHNISIIMPKDSNDMVQPHFSFFESGALQLVEQEVEKGTRAPKDLATSPFFSSPSLPQLVEKELKNVNSPSDFKSIEGAY